MPFLVLVSADGFVMINVSQEKRVEVKMPVSTSPTRTATDVLVETGGPRASGGLATLSRVPVVNEELFRKRQNGTLEALMSFGEQ
jgi:hypothetical protein